MYILTMAAPLASARSPHRAAAWPPLSSPTDVYYIYIYIYIHIYIYVCVCVCMYIYMCVCVYTH